VFRLKVVAFSGSPRAQGNTRTLLDEVLRGATSEGATCEFVDVGSADIRPCKACQSCSTRGTCVQKDGMEQVYPKILEADVLVLGTPVYFWGPSAQMKTFIDRWYALVSGRGRNELRGKKAVVVTAYGDTDPSTPQHVVGMFRTAFHFIGIDLVGTLGVTAIGSGDAAGNEEALMEAFEMGRRICGKANAES
jgi:multimeric flavodoxin WrbA